MAILLTDEYKLLKKVVLQSTPQVNELRLYGKYTSQNAITGETTYKRKLVYYRNVGNITIGSGTAKLGSTSKSFSSATFQAGETTLIEEEKLLNHETDGTIETKNISFSWEGSIGGSGSSSVEIDLLDYPQITPTNIQKDKSTIKVSTFTNKGQTITNVGWRITTDSTYSEYERIDGTTEHIFTNLKPNTTYYVRVYVETDHYNLHSKWINFTTKKNNVVKLRVNGNWKEAIPYINVNGEWKEATPYINVNGTYKEVN